jgi:hypothetical protein
MNAASLTIPSIAVIGQPAIDWNDPEIAALSATGAAM